MITDQAFRDAVLRFEAEESRGSFYDMAVDLLNKGFKTEAYLFLLATWNFASFRYAVKDFDLIGFDDTVSALETNFRRLDGKTIKTVHFGSLREDVSVIYDTLSRIKGIQYTGASKVMHLRNRELFTMWDEYIRGSDSRSRKSYEQLDIVKRGDWAIKRYGTSADDYLQFLEDMQNRFAGVSFREKKKTFAKAIDEFNYVNITLPMQRAEKAASHSGPEAFAAPTDTNRQPAGPVNAYTFRDALQRVFAESQGSFVDVVSGELHGLVGGYPGKNHRMPVCCDVMRKAMQPGDSVKTSPLKGKGATLKIRYLLPR